MVTTPGSDGHHGADDRARLRAELREALGRTDTRAGTGDRARAVPPDRSLLPSAGQWSTDVVAPRWVLDALDPVDGATTDGDGAMDVWGPGPPEGPGAASARSAGNPYAGELYATLDGAAGPGPLSSTVVAEMYELLDDKERSRALDPDASDEHPTKGEQHVGSPLNQAAPSWIGSSAERRAATPPASDDAVLERLVSLDDDEPVRRRRLAAAIVGVAALVVAGAAAFALATPGDTESPDIGRPTTTAAVTTLTSGAPSTTARPTTTATTVPETSTTIPPTTAASATSTTSHRPPATSPTTRAPARPTPTTAPPPTTATTPPPPEAPTTATTEAPTTATTTAQPPTTTTQPPTTTTSTIVEDIAV